MRCLCFVLSAVLLAACQRPDGSRAGEPREPDPTSPSLANKETPQRPANQAEAQLAPLSGSRVSGSLALNQSPQGVRLVGAVQGLKADGEFELQISQESDCTAYSSGSAARDTQSTGDRVELRSNHAGVAQVDTTAAASTIGTGLKNDVLGRALVLHEHVGANGRSATSSQPIACGIILTSNDQPAR